MLIGPTLEDRWLTQLLLQVCLLNAMLTTLKANPGWGLARGIAIGLWLLALAGSLIALAPVPGAWERFALGIETLSLLPLLALLAAGILRFVYRSRRLTIDGVFATVVVYMIVAIFFSRLYLLVLGINPLAFDLPVPVAERTPYLLQVDLLYYSLITQCSVGYGDVLPMSDTARMLAVIQAVVGQFYMAVVVAIFVGMYATQRRD
jgi:Ion channel